MSAGGFAPLWGLIVTSLLPWLRGLSMAVIAEIVVSLLVLNFLWDFIPYHYIHWRRDNVKGQVPPRYPSLIPYLGSVLELALDHRNFGRRISFYRGKLTANRVRLMGRDYYYLQDREALEKMFRDESMSSAIEIYAYSQYNVFGISRKAANITRTDNSGPFPQPHPLSNVFPHNRVEALTHGVSFRGLTGPGLRPLTQRYTKRVPMNFKDFATEWSEFGDLARFFRERVGEPILRAILGPTMFRLNPTFLEDLFEYDKALPYYAYCMPRFLMPKAYRVRERLADQFKLWYQYAREHADPSLIDADGDGDPIWGSEMMRNRQQLLHADEHDDDTLAHLDTGLAWASVGNLVPTTMLSVYHIFRDRGLLRRVRHDLQEYLSTQTQTIHELDPQQLAKDVPLLSSIYAETMRLYIRIYSMYSSPHEEVHVGKWKLPKGALALVTSHPNHMDASFWNTRDGKHPVETFWADRFMVDPFDPSSGPINPKCNDTLPRPKEASSDQKPYFSMEGCQGAWLPYGGGHAMCPGRFFAKAIIVFTTALLVHEYDFEYLATAELTNTRYGFGIADLKKPVPFRIRKRRDLHL
ncbi:Pfs, NACHT and ankyrin domain protein [Annulohypoxylon moriforme]|nr:Pfs, NACHT and ankyrin domain protein [Annulohypoxylon moriforme]